MCNAKPLAQPMPVRLQTVGRAVGAVFGADETAPLNPGWSQRKAKAWPYGLDRVCGRLG